MIGLKKYLSIVLAKLSQKKLIHWCTTKDKDMYLITTAFQKSRSKQRPDKPGKVLFHISSSQDNELGDVVRSISSDIYGERDSIIEANRSEIVRYIRVIYYIIEKLDSSKHPFTIDDIANDFRLAIKGDTSMKSLLDKSEIDIPLRADLVRIGNEFKRDFRFIYPEIHVIPDKLLQYIMQLSQQAKNEGKQSMSRSYNSTRSSLSKFLNDQDISFKNIDRQFISRYSDWLKENGVIDSTQSFYLRTLRSIINRAKEDGIDIKEDDMFRGMNTRVVFSENKERNVMLNRETMNRILTLKFQNNPEAEVARDMFLFAFYCRGMELIDVINLTYLNIQGDILTYNRRGVGRPRVVTLDKFAKNIIKKYKNTSDYIFPIKDSYKGNQQYSVNDRVRRHIKEIGSAVGFPELTFSMNISSWKQLLSQLNISELLLKSV